MYQLFSWHLPSREYLAALILSALLASARIGSMSIVGNRVRRTKKFGVTNLLYRLVWRGGVGREFLLP